MAFASCGIGPNSFLAVSTSVDTILEDSFPASDPPSWTLGIEPPRHAEPAGPDREICSCCGRPLGPAALQRAGARFCSDACAATATPPEAASLR
jgi:hypothetical protein